MDKQTSEKRTVVVNGGKKLWREIIMARKMLFQVLETAKHGFKSSGVELNYWLVLYSRYQAWKQGQKNAAFYRKDLWKVTHG